MEVQSSHHKHTASASSKGRRIFDLMSLCDDLKVILADLDLVLVPLAEDWVVAVRKNFDFFVEVGQSGQGGEPSLALTLFLNLSSGLCVTKVYDRVLAR